MHDVLGQLGFRQMEEDPGFFIKVGEDGERVMLVVQKDDSLSDKRD